MLWSRVISLQFVKLFVWKQNSCRLRQIKIMVRRVSLLKALRGYFYGTGKPTISNKILFVT
ncbi:hypothetical protein FHS57_002600 [Runella defluvii]|uniref:Uncharacterized protein n=1 Tax=Runella defluvii TaxID=370973 RepID=A0A7W5ZMS6_9BACT|nr:hypothetical protein [Runella defluvii]